MRQHTIRRMKLVCALLSVFFMCAFFINWYRGFSCRLTGFSVGFAWGCIMLRWEPTRRTECYRELPDFRRPMFPLVPWYSERWGSTPGSSFAIEPELSIPLWIPFAVVFALYLYFKRREAQFQSGFCLVCRYDLTGNTSGTCPECGTTSPASFNNLTSQLQ